MKRQRELHVLNRAGIPGWRDRLSPGFRVQPIDAAFLRAERIKNREAVAAEICSCWMALEEFLERGFGHAVLCGDEIVCWCTAECVSQPASAKPGSHTCSPIAIATFRAIRSNCLNRRITV